MRIVYCHACGAVTTNVFGERDVCTNCGNQAERMQWRRPWQSYASGVILFAAAALFLWGPTLDTIVRALIFFAVLIVSIILANWGLSQTRRQVLAEVAKRDRAEGKA